MTDKTTITPSIFHSGVFPVSIQMLRDAKIDVGSWVGRKLARRILKKVNSSLTTTLVGAVTSATTGFSFNIDYDELMDLYFALDQEYVNSPRCYWSGNRATLQNIVGLAVDTTGQPTFGSGLRDRPATSILGAPFVTNHDMDTMVQNTEKMPLIFGDFDAFQVHTVGAVPVLRRLDELYAANLAVGFQAYWEVGGALIDPGTNPIVGLTTGTLSGDPAGPVEV